MPYIVFCALAYTLTRGGTYSYINCHRSGFPLVSVLAIFNLIMGVVIDSISMLAISIPFLQPIIQQAGIEPYYFAMVAIVATQVGIITPPLGMAAYTVKGVAEKDVTLENVFSGSLYFLVVMLVVLGLVKIYPEISTVLINIFMN